jgi:hypothetical protein
MSELVSRVSLPDAEKALGELEGSVRRDVPPGHHLARRVLLTLGDALRREPGTCGALVERARAAGRAAGKAWEQAVRTELSLACGEFAQGLDPRYLGLPNYDLDYTRAARERLADRLLAAAELGFHLPPREKEILGLADRVLAMHLARREAPPSPDSPPAPATPVQGWTDRARSNRRHK